MAGFVMHLSKNISLLPIMKSYYCLLSPRRDYDIEQWTFFFCHLIFPLETLLNLLQ